MPSPSSSSFRRHLATRVLAPLLLVAMALSPVESQAQCMSLKGSKACPSFANLQIDLSKLSDFSSDMSVGINITSFKDVAGFDKAIMSSPGFMTSSSCTGLSANPIQYQTTVLCKIVVQQLGTSCQKDIRNMCNDSCTLYQQALSKAVASTCPKDSKSTDFVTLLANVCAQKQGSGWGGLAGTETGCFKAQENEASTCGMGSQQNMCQHCSSPAGAADECCKSAAAVACPKPVTSSVSAAGSPSSSTTGTVSPTTTPIAEKANDSPIPGLSMAAFGGIIAGGVVLILLFFALIVCCMRRGRHNKTGASHPGGAKGVSRQMSSGSGRYNISAPKMQEEGFASSNMMNNSAPIPMTALPMNNAAHTGPVTTAGAVAAASVVADQDRKNSMIDDAPPNGKKFCQALYPYQASMADELELTPGDIVNVHRIFDDGWAVGMNMNTSNEGAFPIVCVTFVEESALDDDFEDVNMHAMAPMTHREDDSGRQSPRSSLPSRASSPVHLPRRHSSMLRDSAILPLGNLSSPLASSPLAGHNANGGHHNNNLAPPAMRDTMLSDASSINRWWDGEGSKQQ